MRILVHFFLGLVTLFCIKPGSSAQQSSSKISIRFDEQKTYQIIQNFAASDAWACQFAGNWPAEKKNAIADWLFSMDTLSNGNPKGIGLSLWRYNLGAGSAEQADSSGIKDEWRRAG
ncbi:MAG: glycoside hydrolase, partial [Bacteroidota bacterium]